MSKTKKIENLTAEQEAKIPQYIDEYHSIGVSTTPCDRVEAEKALLDTYAYLGHKTPSFIWADSPFAGAKVAARLLLGREEVTEEEAREQLSSACYGSFEASWVSLYAFIEKELPVQSDALIGIMDRLVRHCGVLWTFETVVVMTEKPVEIHIKDNKLHNPNGLAIRYKDGEGVFMLDGVKYKSMMQMALAKMADKK